MNFNDLCKIINKKLFRRCRFSIYNKYRVCNNKACKRCYHKSLQSHINNVYYDYSDLYKYNQYIPIPRFIIKRSKRIYQFICDCNKIYKDTPINIIYNKKWCSNCIIHNRVMKAKKYYEQFEFMFDNEGLVIVQN